MKNGSHRGSGVACCPESSKPMMMAAGKTSTSQANRDKGATGKSWAISVFLDPRGDIRNQFRIDMAGQLIFIQ